MASTFLSLSANCHPQQTNCPPPCSTVLTTCWRDCFASTIGQAATSNSMAWFTRHIGVAASDRLFWRERRSLLSNTSPNACCWGAMGASPRGWHLPKPRGQHLTLRNSIWNSMRSEEHTSELQSQFHLV